MVGKMAENQPEYRELQSWDAIRAWAEALPAKLRAKTGPVSETGPV
jgi:hypothetical protein